MLIMNPLMQDLPALCHWGPSEISTEGKLKLLSKVIVQPPP